MTTQPVTLEQQLFALLAEHDLTNLSLHVMTVGEDKRHVIYANAHGAVGGFQKCCGSKIGETAIEVIGSAISELNNERRPRREYVAPLALLGEAA